MSDEVIRQTLDWVEGWLRTISDRRALAMIREALERYLELLNRQLGAVTPGCVVFDPLPLGAWGVGGTFVEGIVTMEVQQFQWGNGLWTALGFAEVETGTLAGGSGQELEVNNVNVDFDFGGPVNAVTLNFGAYGGNLNLRLNGAHQNFQNFPAINGASIGGVNVTVTSAAVPGGMQGTLELQGTIKSFAIGGQELWIDDVCYK